jgi:adenylate cyclase
MTTEGTKRKLVAIMPTEGSKRKLVAILSADAKGYSRLMGEDEKATVETIKKYREVMREFIQQNSGRVVDSPGDNLLAEFSSVIDAVECAVKIQEELKHRNEKLPENKKMEFRIGIHHGDVIEDEGTIYGDGVIVATRIQELADGGGICISRTSFDSVKNKLDLGYKYIGEQSVKNISEPVRIYKVLTESEYAGKIIGEKSRIKNLRIGLFLVISIAVLAVIFSIWNFYFRPPPFEPASVKNMAHPLPEKPSIAVLPFVNMSGDPEQEYFSDGLSEEIITALAKTPKMFVIARNSTFSYKGKSVKANQIAEELGVRYVLEGSVRKEREKLRVTVQLIDALTGHHLWAERYDRELGDIFAIQDEITMQIISALRVKLTDGELARMRAKCTDNLEAYLKVSQASEYLQRFTKDDTRKARQIAEEVIALDPNYAAGYMLLGFTYWINVVYRWTESPKESLKKALDLGQKAVSLDDDSEASHRLLGSVYQTMRQPDKAKAEFERAIAVGPNSSHALAAMGLFLNLTGKYREAVKTLEKAITLDPFAPTWFFQHLENAYYGTGRINETIEVCHRVITVDPNYAGTLARLGSAFLAAGKPEEALVAFDKYLSLRQNPASLFIGQRAIALVNAGMTEEALTIMEDLISGRPDDIDGYRQFSVVLNLLGRHEQALQMGKKGANLPRGPSALSKNSLGLPYLMLEQYDQAISHYQGSIKHRSDYVWERIGLTASYSLAGRMEEARAEVLEILKINSQISLDDIARNGQFNFQTADKNRFIDALRNAGLE